MEPVLRSSQVLKQDAEELWHERKGVLEYVKHHQALGREDRAAWRDAQKIQAEKEKRAVEIQMAQIEAAREQA